MYSKGNDAEEKSDDAIEEHQFSKAKSFKVWEEKEPTHKDGVTSLRSKDCAFTLNRKERGAYGTAAGRSIF